MYTYISFEFSWTIIIVALTLIMSATIINELIRRLDNTVCQDNGLRKFPNQLRYNMRKKRAINPG